MGLAVKGKVPPPFPPHVAADVDESRGALRPRQDAGARRRRRHRPGREGARHGSRATTSDVERPEHPYDEPDSFAAPVSSRGEPRARQRWEARIVKKRRLLQGLPRHALGEGARHLDAGARAEGRLRADRARVGHLLRRGRHPRGGARLLPPPERAHPRVRRGDRLRHADDGLQRLHAQPAAGEPPAADRRGSARARERQPRAGRRAALQRHRRASSTSSG